MRHSLRLVVTRHADCCIRIIFDCFIPSVIIVPSLSSSSGCPRHPTSSVRCKYTRRLRRRLLDFSRESRGCVDSIIVVRHEHQSHRFHSLSFRPWVSLFLFATLLPSPLPLSLVKRGKDSGGSAPVLITILKREASKVHPAEELDERGWKVSKLTSPNWRMDISTARFQVHSISMTA